MSAKPDAAPQPPVKAPRKPAARRTSSGDTAPKDSPDAIENFEVNEAVDAARDAKLSAVSDIVATLARHDTHSIAETLQAIMAGEVDFAFGNLPPGEYTLKAFFNGEPVEGERPFAMAKGDRFSHADRECLLATLGGVVRHIIPRYRALADRGQIEIAA